jgi:hypothetical protein
MNCILKEFPKWQEPKLSRIGDELFEKGTVYRYMNQGNGYVIVNGVMMNIEVFNKLFMDYHTFAVSKLKELGVYDNTNECLVSLNRFKNDYADVRVYGRGMNKRFIVFVGHPKQNMFGVYVNPVNTKANAIKEAYCMLTDLLNGDKDLLDCEDVMWGNSGIPMTYHGIRIR